jgi:biotin carboxylase
MSRLLMIESWVNANGVILPQKIRALGHSYVLLTRDAEHYAKQSPIAGGHPVLNLAEAVVEVDTNDVRSVLRRAAALHAEQPFSGVITSCDYYLPSTARVARELGLPGVSPEAMMLAVRKDMVREACRRAGVLGPAFRVAARASEVLSFARDVGYPVVVKPVDLCASEKVALARGDVEAVRAFDEAIGDTLNSRGQPRQRIVLVESYIEGDELCVETISEAGRTTVLGISGKTLSAPPGFLEIGSHVPAALDETQARAVAEYVRSVLAAIGYGHGLAHVEVRLARSGPTLIEVNPRMGGDYVSELYEHTSGVDISALEVGLAIGAPSEHPSALPDVHGSAALACLLPPRAGRILRVDGAEALARDPRYRRVTIKPVCGLEVPEPRDNSSFIGFVIAVDRDGQRAREIALEGLARLRVVMAE